MTENLMWAGLDLGERETHVCIIDDSGATLHEQKCETSLEAITGALSQIEGRALRLVAAEAGSVTHVVRKLRDANYPVALFEARKASKFLSIRSSKTDLGDARGLADLGRLGQHTVSQVHIKSPECERLHSELILRARLVRMRVASDNALRSRFALHGVRIKRQRSPDSMRSSICDAIEKLKANDGIDLESVRPLLDVCLNLRSYVQSLDKEFDALAKANPVCKRLMEVFGVGPLCALAFYSTIEDPSRLCRASDVAPYLGLVPKRRQSGEKSYTKRITKTGSKLTRSLLVTAALNFMTRGPDSELKDWALALKQRIGTRKAQVAVARKLSIVLLTMWKSGVKFEPYPSRTRRAADV